MRKVIEAQLQLGEEDIAAIQLNPKSRDDIPKILRGLQHLYTTPDVREQVFAVLQEVLAEGTDGKADPNTGRPGMTQWRILVLGVVRLGLNADYDRVHELANEHKTLRQILGHSDFADNTRYELQTIKDNLRLFTHEILDRINQIVVGAGHQALQKSAEEGLSARCNSFVVETDVHYPTDTNLLLDAIRKAVETCGGLCNACGLTEWRQYRCHIHHMKKAYRRTTQLKRSEARDEGKREARRDTIKEAHRSYIEQAQRLLDRARVTRGRLRGIGFTDSELADLDWYVACATHQIDLIRRRVLHGEHFPHKKKIFSIIEPHTEWISKGKAGVPVELGLRVAVVEDREGFILHHQVMENTTDDQIAVPIVAETLDGFPELKAISMDTGFHSQFNQVELAKMLDRTVIPKKGKCNATEAARESDPDFRRLRREHSAVESAINALEVHGLDRCMDHGLHGFKRYVALSVVARNIHQLGAILRREEATYHRRSGPKAA